MPRILCISATSRPNNYTARALGVVVDELCRNGADVEVLDARELHLPFPGQPDDGDAERLRLKVEEASAVILATPEYHGGYAAMCKLIIENLGFPSVMADKPLGLLGVAAGRIGAIKSLEQLRAVCSHVGALVLPRAVSIAGVRKAFTPDGACTDPATEAALRGLARSLLDFLESYAGTHDALETAVRHDGPPWVSHA
ncbi:MAG: NAD(P)H-dependent oxidoreductase [Gemmatimonadales bacterium]|jgi:NAD(P)H-dependent FMN reductase|nr:MAG: NAD(P)H-dependent oxidoreductase [Gemmatimonadales bacterium]